MPRPLRAWRHRAASLAVGIAVIALLSGCGLFGDKKPGKDISAFDVKVGQCFTPPTDLKAELSTLRALPCDVEHTQEAYALVPYSTAEDGSIDPRAQYPGSDVLTAFADGSCAQRYSDYVGVPYSRGRPRPGGWTLRDGSSVGCSCR